MILKYNYENGVKRRIWQDEFQTHDLKPMKIIEKDFITTNENIGSSVNIFDYTCRILMRLLFEKDVNISVVEKIIKAEY